MKPAQPPRGSEKFGLASKVIVYGPRNFHAKFERFLIKVTIVTHSGGAILSGH